MKLYCPNCGEEIPKKDKFCKYCGKPLENLESAHYNEEEIIRTVENGYAVAAILTDIITTPLFKIKQKDGQPMLNEEGIPEFEADKNGVKILNKDKMIKIINDSQDSVEKYKS